MCLREARLQALCWQSTQNSSNRRFAVDPGWSGGTRTVWIGTEWCGGCELHPPTSHEALGRHDSSPVWGPGG
jgi:hypothetical protein